jgi:hypothetical protein
LFFLWLQGIVGRKKSGGGWFRALHVITDLAGEAGFPAGSAVSGTVAEIDFTSVSYVFITVSIVSLTPGDFTFPG